MAVLVTGGTGMIGSNIARLLAEQGRKVVVYDVSERPGQFEGVADRVKVELGSVTDLSHVMHVVQDNDVDGIINCAAILGTRSSPRPLEGLEVNIMGCANMLEAARLMHLRRVIIFSSAAAMGGPEDISTPRTEDDASCLPLAGIYPLSKLTCEQLTYTYRQLYSVDAAAVRPRAVFGPGGERYIGKIPIRVLIREAMQGKPIRYETGGDTALDFIYVKDLAKAVVQAYDSPALKHYLYNLSFGQFRTVFQICEVLRKVFPRLPIEMGPGLWPGYLTRGQQVDQTWRPALKPPHDISRAREDFGFEPEWDLDRAIPDYVQWLKKTKA